MEQNGREGGEAVFKKRECEGSKPGTLHGRPSRLGLQIANRLFEYLKSLVLNKGGLETMRNLDLNPDSCV